MTDDAAFAKAEADYRRVVEQTRKVNDAQFAYWHSEPLMTDDEYEAERDALIQLESETGITLENSPTFDRGEWRLMRKHVRPMCGVRHVTTKEAYADWLKKVTKAAGGRPHIVARPEYTGARLDLVYNRGYLVSAITYYNGLIGKPVVYMAHVIDAIPRRLREPVDANVHGTVVASDYRLAEHMSTRGWCPENFGAAAVTLETLDYQYAIDIGLHFIADDAFVSGSELNTSGETRAWLTDNGFDCGFVFNNVTFDKAIKEIDKAQADTDYAIEGVIFDVDDLKLRDKLGYDAHYAHWNVAYSFDATCEWRIVDDIKWVLDFKARLVPQLWFDTREICGLPTSCIDGKSFAFMEISNLSIGDEVCLTREGERKVTFKRRRHTFDMQEPEYPLYCPLCGERLGFNGEHLVCENILCRPNEIERLRQFCYTMELSVGIETVKTIAIAGYSFPITFLKVRHDELLKAGLSLAIADDLIEQIHLLRSKPIEWWLPKACPKLPPSVIQKIARQFMSFKVFYNTKLERINGKQNKHVREVWRYMHEDPFCEFIAEWTI